MATPQHPVHEPPAQQTDDEGPWGKRIAMVGLGLILLSVLMGFLQLTSNPFVHNLLMYGGMGVGGVGLLLWKVLKI